MPGNSTDRDPKQFTTRNHTLSALPQPLLDKLSPHLSRINLPQGTSLIRPGREIQWVYFLERGMASMNSLDLAGTAVEVGIVGREGIVGISALLGQKQTKNAVTMQGAGDGLRIRADVLREHLTLNGDLMRSMHTFIYALLEQTTQLVLCNRLHELEPRLARWLLMTSDMMETQTLHLTQEFLAEMLGVGRPAVTIAAGILQRSGAITYSRGLVEIANRDQLQSIACECYDIIRSAYIRVYSNLFA